MAITEISRDWGSDPSIVRIISDDGIDDVFDPNYLINQADNIKSVNKGAFTFRQSDQVLIFGGSNLNYKFNVDTINSSGLPTLQTTVTQKNMIWHKNDADSAASDVTSELTVGFVGRNHLISTILFVPNAALTANDTNYAVLSVYSRDLNGANQTLVAEVETTTSGTGNWTAFKFISIGANFINDRNTRIYTLEITKQGSGVVVPSGFLRIPFTGAA